MLRVIPLDFALLHWYTLWHWKIFDIGELSTKRYLSLEFDSLIYYSFLKCLIWIYSIKIVFNIPTDFTLETIWFIHDIYVSQYSWKQLWISLLVIVETETIANHLLWTYKFLFFLIFFLIDSLHAKLNSHYEA